MIYVTSDWHFSHDKEFVWKNRGYSSVDDMNENIIQIHNHLVHMEDEVYVLGDCCLGGSATLAKNKQLMERLNGKLHIIFGNHCTAQRQEMYKNLSNVVETGYAAVLRYKKYNFYLSHYPTLCSNKDSDKPLKIRTINLCGHSHTSNPFSDWDKGLIYHVEWDAHGKPVLLDNIIEDIKNHVK